jgi:hypothetical protein
MISSKKGLQTHIVLLLVISLIMTIVIVSVLGSFFKNDHKNCLNYEFEIKDKCIDGNSLKITIENTGNTIVNFQGSEYGNKFQLMPKESEVFGFSFRDKDNFIQVMPYFEDLQGEEFICRGKTVKVDLRRLIKCSG